MTRRWPAVAAATTGILVGAAIVASRSVIDQLGPASLAFWRYLIGFCCLLPLVLLTGRPRFARRDLAPIALLGITQFGILIVLMNYALQVIPSARVALIFATMPLLTMLFAAALRYETLSWTTALGVLVTVVGVGVALGERVASPSSVAETWAGELAALGSAVSGAVCSVLYRPYLRRYPALPLSAVAMLASVGVLAALAAGEGLFSDTPRLTMGGWLAVLFIGISSGVGYYLWLWALGQTAPTNVTIFLALSPLTATGLGALFLSEPVSPPFLLGLACVVLGLWLAHRPGR